ncbi:uncharacterized protein Eint_090475 [Encephalitozoon intestinalis ATCC 50506]|uniref:Uncharacterized protein n=1 Tax=Encephalitozoon intestinalis (strain ATCC 50506) TaxID=876142 RepID=W8P940_ENCIT|nr:uncharacterized protein Eint_090475 [Encephalitozoon intestinalis ATCC 50506]AHL30148.1 hypothetical protein Eint_090475 [Encephalitozoon intestinalis ATCC 50506]UTX45980.1 hypothetical protein GPK93_09g15660 [Encephalitozoon intestinalis]
MEECFEKENKKGWISIQDSMKRSNDFWLKDDDATSYLNRFVV